MRWLRAYRCPCQKIMIIAGLGHVVCHPAKSNLPRDSRTGSNEDIRMDGSHYYSRCGQLKLYFLTSYFT
ncbi:hypothetical protein COCMIDRAFT_100707 [Bipolaris oryzae ATCC 44560]|uniref:Uncharacterized protein n=1 Tax=Bipolaris oryzae ATCC 44560 TaxID=930090 RepID=W6Z0M1_COCMI|nr:uncharacterized protein COCMIDRAFT_100707 [Bipolaris oryzae ATCC 44560]EUC43510.1 hypothetical protein COCMIDRAFT_100707 [Bipolaris oryzae ATCC 44560]